jgi:hypothetical protein
MSLLDRINQKNQETQQGMQAQEQEAQAEAAKSDAQQQASVSRQEESAAMSQGTEVELEGEDASPEEQAQFTALEKNLTEMLFKDGIAEQLVEMVRSAQDPTQGVSEASFDVVSTLREQNPDVTPDVLMALGESTVEQVAEVVEAAAPELALTQTQLTEAYGLAVKQWMQAFPDEVDADMRDYLGGVAPEQLSQNQQQPQPSQQSPLQQAAGVNNNV